MCRRLLTYPSEGDGFFWEAGNPFEDETKQQPLDLPLFAFVLGVNWQMANGRWQVAPSAISHKLSAICYLTGRLDRSRDENHPLDIVGEGEHGMSAGLLDLDALINFDVVFHRC